MVRNMASGNALRAPVGARPRAAKARGVAVLRVARGMESTRASGLENTCGRELSWRGGWDVDAMRFGIRKSRTDDDAGGEQWSVIDFYVLRVVAHADRKTDAQLVADALEYLSCDAPVSEFEAAIRHA